MMITDETIFIKIIISIKSIMKAINCFGISLLIYTYRAFVNKNTHF